MVLLTDTGTNEMFHGGLNVQLTFINVIIFPCGSHQSGPGAQSPVT